MSITAKMSETRQERSNTPIRLLHSSHTRLHTIQGLRTTATITGHSES